MSQIEVDTPKRPAPGAIISFALVALILAIAYRGIRWLSNVEEEAQRSSVVEQSHEASADWEANAKRFEAEKGQAAAVLLAAEKVEPFRIQPLLKPQGRLEDYPIVSRADNLGHDFATRLASLLLDPKSYVIPGRGVKMCLFQPRVAFRAWKGSQFVDVLICFDCQQLMVVESDPEVPERSLGDKSARFRVGGDFDPVFAEIMRLTREAFPGDRSLEEALSSVAPDGSDNLWAEASASSTAASHQLTPASSGSSVPQKLSRPFRPRGDRLSTQGIGLRPKPWAMLSRPVGPEYHNDDSVVS